MCITDGNLTGEQRPNAYSHWSAEGVWVEDDKKKAELNAAAINRQIEDIDNQIAELESKTYRPLREISLGIDEGTARDKLAAFDAQITALRAQRAALVAQL